MSVERPRVGVVGVGSMGQNHARVLSKIPSATLSGVYDLDSERARAVALRSGSAAARDLDELIERSDALVIAVPTTLHREVAERCIAAGRHVLVEKPLAPSVEDGEALVSAAARANVQLLVGHIERFSSVVAVLEEVLKEERILTFSARRLSQPTPHVEVDVVLDLMIHDLDLAMALAPAGVDHVAAAGRSAGGEPDHVVAVLRMDDGVVCDLTASKLAQRKIRELTLSTERGFITVDHIAGDIVLYRHTVPEYVPGGARGARFREQTLLERPYVAYVEPLQREHEHFVEVVRGDATPLVSGRTAIAVLAVATRIRELVAARVPVSAR